MIPFTSTSSHQKMCSDLTTSINQGSLDQELERRLLPSDDISYYIHCYRLTLSSNKLPMPINFIDPPNGKVLRG